MIERVVLVSGTRDGVKESLIFNVLNNILNKHGASKMIVIHGNAKGVDSQADKWCRMNGVHALKCDAMWTFYGKKAAGPLRNSAMIELIALLQKFIDLSNSVFNILNLEVSVEAFPPPHEYGGTRNAIKTSKNLGLKVNIYEENV